MALSRMVATCLIATLVGVGANGAECVIPIAGDPIGSNSTLTDATGGFTAVLDQGANMGQPAILVPLNGDELLKEFRVVTFGASTAEGAIRFDRFAYHLDVWPVDEYFEGAEPLHSFSLGTPRNWRLVNQGANRVVPETTFGTSGGAGDDAATYDMVFDLGNLPAQVNDDFFSTPLPAGGWVFAFQSWHDTSANGTLRVAGSVAEDGPLPLFSRGTQVPRGILGGQDPGQIFLRWGMSVSAFDETHVHGDFNEDGQVNLADYTVWRNGLGSIYDIGDYECWKSAYYEAQGNRKTGGQLQSGSASALSQIPEPAGRVLVLLLMCLMFKWQKGSILPRQVSAR